MAINIDKYVDITSGVGGTTIVRQRDLIGRLFTTNPRVPIDAVLTISSADDAIEYFGAGTPEALRAQLYFSFISKNITAPERLSYSRWADVNSAPRIYGERTLTTLSQWTAITAGTLNVTLGANTAALTGLNFSSATTLAQVASILQTAIRGATGAQFTNATVTYDPVAQTFTLAGGVAGVAAVSIADSGANDIGTKLGWRTVGAVLSPGVVATSLTNTLVDTVGQNNNFGSFAFVPALDQTQIIEVATWNATRNIEFIYCVPTDAGDAVSLSAALFSFPGVALTLIDDTNSEFDEMVPMIILAATDYTKRNSAQNYMYQIFNLTPKVTSTNNSDAYDGIRVNYYGVTQTGGQLIAFYQRGLMMGGASSPTDINIFANEIWLKDAAATALLSLLLAVPRVPANPEGRAQVLAILQDAINSALFNGVISVGKELTTLQKLYVTQLSGDPDAWYQVQGVGYWLDCRIEAFETLDGHTEYQAVYMLIYGKDDAIRRVEGQHVLI